MIIIDGSQGEGGGQILRSSVALSLVTAQPVKIQNIRAGRKVPGLRRQHLTAVRAAQQISNSTVSGDEVGSTELQFHPGATQAGDYQFDVGTAGSTSLVLQTVLPALLTLPERSTVTLRGGTHNPFAPPFDFLDRAYFPLLNRMGPNVTAELRRPGFYPAGGGEVVYTVNPSEKLCGFDLRERGKLIGRRVRALVANLPRHIGERECQLIAQKTNWKKSDFEVEELTNSKGPGNVLLIELRHEQVNEVCTGFGQQGVPAERVAARTLRAARNYLDAGVPVGEYLADQLLLPLGIAAAAGEGGAFRTLEPSQHTRTHIEVLKSFLPVTVEVRQDSDGQYLISVS